MDKSRVRTPVVVGVLCVLAWAIGDKISYQVRAIVRGGGTAGDVLDGFWKDLPVLTHFSFDGPDVLAGMIAAASVLLAVVYRIGARTNIRAHQEHGSARWGGPRDIRPMVDPDPARNLLFTRTECLSLDTRATRRNLNALVVGASGTGKTSRFVVPNLLQASTSYVVTDPGGRVKAATEGRLRANGYEIRTLDLVNPAAHGDSFNPFAHIDAGNAEVELLILVDALMANAAPMPGALHDALSDNAERALLAALCAQVYASDPHGASLGAVADLLAQRDGHDPVAEGVAVEAPQDRQAGLVGGHRVDGVDEAGMRPAEPHGWQDVLQDGLVGVDRGGPEGADEAPQPGGHPGIRARPLVQGLDPHARGAQGIGDVGLPGSQAGDEHGASGAVQLSGEVEDHHLSAAGAQPVGDEHDAHGGQGPRGPVRAVLLRVGHRWSSSWSVDGRVDGDGFGRSRGGGLTHGR